MTLERGWDRTALAAIAVVSAAVVLAVGLLMLAAPPPGVGAGVAALPALNALLNGTSALLLTGGYLSIRRRRRRAHVTCMLSAFAVSVLFLVSYVTYHYHAGSKPFGGQGWIRPVYFALLLTHILLAAVIVPFALTTIYRGLRASFERHVRIARWTLPLWLYVSVTGVVIYWMLYHR